MKKSNISITELLSGLDSAQIAGIDPAPAQDAPEVSSQRVLELAINNGRCFGCGSTCPHS